MAVILEGPAPACEPPHPTLSAAIAAAGAVESHGYTFIDEAGGERMVPYAELVRRARRVAHQLGQRGYRKGDRLVVVLPETEDFLSVFLGAIWTGVVPVPIYPPLGLGKLGGYLDNAVHIVRAARAKGVVTDKTVHKVLGSLLVQCPDLREVAVVDALTGPGPEAPMAEVAPEDLCFIQFTSGSTSRPKGVMVTHGGLAENSRCIGGEALSVGPDDCGVSWLPLYHDMGLIGFVLTPFFYQVRMVSMAPLTFLKRPHLWLEAISRHKGTITYAPNFAYGLCTRRVRDEQLARLDLSSWRIAGCGAEPIRPDTLEAFVDRFGPAGFSASSLFPSYGMAEATLAVSFADPGTGMRTDLVDAQALVHRHEAARPLPDGEAQRIVSCGKPFSKHAIAVVDDAGRQLGERAVGEIVVRGPSIMPGYFDNAEATAQVLRGGWLHTGDLGYIADGEVYVCGRKKELIIIGGKNYYPQDIEHLVWELPGVRTGNAIAFGAARGDTEELVLVLEARKDADHEEVAQSVRAAVSEGMGLKVADIVVLPPGGLPKTSSGKLQRRKAAELYAEGTLGRLTAEAGRLTAVKHLASSQLAYVRSFIGRVALGRR